MQTARTPDSREKTRRGRIGEEAAEIHYLLLGWECVARRFRIREGEIDLIAAKHDTIAFIEVKTIGNDWGIDPLAKLNTEKLLRMRLVAQAFLQKNPGWKDYYGQFDAVRVYLDESEEPLGLYRFARLDVPAS